MFSEEAILIVEEDTYVALDLSMAVEELNGRVVGPTRLAAEALNLLETEKIAAAIVDCHLSDGDIAAVAGRLADDGVPFVFHGSAHLPMPLANRHPSVPVLIKPLKASAILTCLLNEIRKSSLSGGFGPLPPPRD